MVRARRTNRRNSEARKATDTYHDKQPDEPGLDTVPDGQDVHPLFVVPDAYYNDKATNAHHKYETDNDNRAAGQTCTHTVGAGT